MKESGKIHEQFRKESGISRETQGKSQKSQVRAIKHSEKSKTYFWQNQCHIQERFRKEL